MSTIQERIDNAIKTSKEISEKKTNANKGTKEAIDHYYKVERAKDFHATLNVFSALAKGNNDGAEKAFANERVAYNLVTDIVSQDGNFDTKKVDEYIANNLKILGASETIPVPNSGIGSSGVGGAGR